MLVQHHIEQRRIPGAYLSSCGAKWSRPELKVEHLYERAESAEARADCRDAQIAKIRQWNDAP